MTDPLISVIIPSLDGSRGGNVEKLKEDLKRQTIQDVEVIVVVGVHPNGKARNVGVRKAKGKYLVLIDDDVRLVGNHVFENLIRPFEERKDVGITGASQCIPPDANWFQKEVQRQIPRVSFPVQNEMVDSDMASHQCLAIPTPLYKDVGWENGEILRGTDPDLRHRVRMAGLRVVIVPDTLVYHPQPESLTKLLRTAYRNARDSTWVQRHFPDLVLDLDSGYKKEFAPRRSPLYRVSRGIRQMALALIKGHLIYFWCRTAWALGCLHEKLQGRPGPEKVKRADEQ